VKINISSREKLTLHEVIMLLKHLGILLVLLIWGCSLMAQGDGPRSYLLNLTGLWGINPRAMHLNQNILPAGNILVKEADINVNVFPTTVFHSFGIKGRFAQVQFMFNPANASGRLTAIDPGFPTPVLKTKGFSDGFLGIKLGLIGAPALNAIEFGKHKRAFSMVTYLRTWYSGTYSSKKALNLGTNRVTFDIGFPMAIPIGKDGKLPFWLEVNPSVQFFTPNNDPSFVTNADVSKQQALFYLENHLTKNITPKFWAGVDLRYHYGGSLKLDGEVQDNKINILGGGISAGYQLLSFLGASATYSGILKGDNDAKSDMIRLSLVFAYINMKKLAQPK
jgi:hypothetical protein